MVQYHDKCKIEFPPSCTSTERDDYSAIDWAGSLWTADLHEGGALGRDAAVGVIVHEHDRHVDESAFFVLLEQLGGDCGRGERR